MRSENMPDEVDTKLKLKTYYVRENKLSNHTYSTANRIQTCYRMVLQVQPNGANDPCDSTVHTYVQLYYR